MLKILQAKLQQYMNCKLPDVQIGFIKGRGTRDQIANIHWIIEKAREFQKNNYFCFIKYTKALDCVNNNKLWKILKEMGISNHLTCLQITYFPKPSLLVGAGREAEKPLGPQAFRSGFSAFFKSRLNIWEFTVHVLLKPGLEDSEYYFTNMCCCCCCCCCCC